MRDVVHHLAELVRPPLEAGADGLEHGATVAHTPTLRAHDASHPDLRGNINPREPAMTILNGGIAVGNRRSRLLRPSAA
ncbi:hypothetical protein [Streptomyces sp. NRRL F-5126]|uniref:hypothetical protein n=1 Tax=Streptomyces sp. NRRL F-5126 TaxID=1463857 RepID=UPI0004C6D15F|nr:hypothetical protein [Streptomyces sp. NRRL F-5126]